MFSFNCKLTKNCVFAWQLTKFCTIISYGRFEKFSFVMASTSMVKLKFDKFLKGIGGILIWFFLAGILIIQVFSSTLNNFFKQVTSGTSQFTVMGRHKGLAFSSWISRTPLILQFSLTGGTLTATLTCALSLALILNLTSSKYSYLSLDLTEKTYSSKSLNYSLEHLAMTLSKKGWPGGVYNKLSSLKSIQTSTSQIEPGQRVVLPNWTVVRLTLTNREVSGSAAGTNSSSQDLASLVGYFCYGSVGVWVVFQAGCSAVQVGLGDYQMVRFSSCFSTSFSTGSVFDGELIVLNQKEINQFVIGLKFNKYKFSVLFNSQISHHSIQLSEFKYFLRLVNIYLVLFI